MQDEFDEAGELNVADDLGEEDVIAERSFLFKALRALVGLVLVLALLHISGIYQYSFYKRTSPSASQEVVTARINAETITVPLTIFIIAADQPYGSNRTEGDVRRLIENASRIWDQAGIRLSIGEIHMISKTSVEMQTFFDSPSIFIQGVEGIDTSTINVFLIGILQGINGIAYTGLDSVAVADYTTVFDFRVLAHEMGHIFGLGHTEGSRGQLMYRGANGFDLSLQEIEQARIGVEMFE